jgi:hypothetical protein
MNLSGTMDGKGVAEIMGMKDGEVVITVSLTSLKGA